MSYAWKFFFLQMRQYFIFAIKQLTHVGVVYVYNNDEHDDDYDDEKLIWVKASNNNKRKNEQIYIYIYVDIPPKILSLPEIIWIRDNDNKRKVEHI